LASEEKGFGSATNYPSFGNSKTPWSSPKGEERLNAQEFYHTWLNFLTEKDFTWEEEYTLSEAPDRRIRRFVLPFLSNPILMLL